MPDTSQPVREPHLVRIEPHHRLVVLARTLQAEDPRSEAALESSALDSARFGQSCLGQALYRHRAVYQNASQAAVWSHLELSYFRDMLPSAAVEELVVHR